jgi:hypothetical protein
MELRNLIYRLKASLESFDLPDISDDLKLSISPTPHEVLEALIVFILSEDFYGYANIFIPLIDKDARISGTIKKTLTSILREKGYILHDRYLSIGNYIDEHSNRAHTNRLIGREDARWFLNIVITPDTSSWQTNK